MEQSTNNLQEEFFKPFKPFGVVAKCFDWMAERYNLGYKYDEADAQTPQKPLPDKWRHYYDEVLPKEIAEAAAAFDGSVFPNVTDVLNTPLMKEIACNLDVCKDDKQAQRYIFSLLKPFKVISDRLHPVSEISKHKGDAPPVVGIKQLQKDMEKWQGMPPDTPLHDINGKPCGTPCKQVLACQQAIKRHEWQITRLEAVANEYCRLLGVIDDDARWMQQGTIESYLSDFCSIAHRFAAALDAMLLERGINLMWYQKQSGIYLFEHRDITTLEMYCGSLELATKYIEEAVPKIKASEEQQAVQQPAEPALPKELDTPEAKAYFERAMELGFIKVVDGKYHWQKSMRLCSYFCDKVAERLNLYCGVLSDGRPKVSWQPFEQVIANADDLTGHKNGYQKCGTLPSGYKIVDSIF